MDAEAGTRIDALLPPAMAEKAERIGVDKTRGDTLSLLALAVLAGAFIGFGSIFSITVAAGADGALPYGLARLLSGLAFSLGLILVIVGGAELFTGNNLMIMAVASRRVGLADLARAWSLAYVGNLAGSVGLGFLVFVAGIHAHGGGAIGLVALGLAEAKAALSPLQALTRGVLANILVCLAVWLCFSARSTTDRILAIVPPIAAFVAIGFEHSVANMFLFAFALAIDAAGGVAGAVGDAPRIASLTIGGAAMNLLWTTIGNMLGGALVGITYWFVYLRPRRQPARPLKAGHDLPPD